MRRGSCVGIVLLAIGLFATPGLAQSTGGTGPPGDREVGRLKQNYPNPFNPETTIPFELPDELFEGGKSVVVSLRIYNVLQQLVAVPVAKNHPEGNGALIESLRYDSPGAKEAHWNGHDRNGRQVASGVYYYMLIINGQKSDVRKMVVLK